MIENAASTRDTAPDEGVWISVTEAAARVGVSEKTLRKRIAAGTVEAEKIALDGGGWKWRVLAQRLESVGTVGSQNDADLNSERLEVPSASNRSADVPTVPTAALPNASKRAASKRSHGDENDLRVLAVERENAMLREALQRERENADQWRAQVEAANRQAAESAAALREYLKITAKSLPSREYSQPPEIAQGFDAEAKNAAAGKNTATAGNAPQRAPGREPRPLWKLLLGLR
jgi:hypothetical protein